MIQQLESQSPITRLQVINQTMELWQQQLLTTNQVSQLEEYFKLLKDIEIEPVILAKIDRSLEQLSPRNSQPVDVSHSHYAQQQKNTAPVRQTVDLRELN